MTSTGGAGRRRGAIGPIGAERQALLLQRGDGPLAQELPHRIGIEDIAQPRAIPAGAGALLLDRKTAGQPGQRGVRHRCRVDLVAAHAQLGQQCRESEAPAFGEGLFPARRRSMSRSTSTTTLHDHEGAGGLAHLRSRKAPPARRRAVDPADSGPLRHRSRAEPMRRGRLVSCAAPRGGIIARHSLWTERQHISRKRCRASENTFSFGYVAAGGSAPYTPAEPRIAIPTPWRIPWEGRRRFRPGARRPSNCPAYENRGGAYRRRGSTSTGAEAVVCRRSRRSPAVYGRPGTMGRIGGFGPLLRPARAAFERPRPSLPRRRVGTKLKVANRAGRTTRGIDLVAMRNELVVQVRTPSSFSTSMPTVAEIAGSGSR